MKVLVCFLVSLAGVLGSPLSAPNGRIIGGQNATRGQFPYAVSLQYCRGATCQHSCGGALISPSWITSAGLCITEVPSQGSYKAVAGILNLDDTNAERQDIKISHAFIVPDFEGGAGPHDLAIFKTLTPFELNNYIQPIRLVNSGALYNGTADLLGWGSTGGPVNPIMPNTLQTVNVPILSTDACREALDSIISDHPLDSLANSCTGPLTGDVNVCTGDYGSPLVQNNVLMGIVSWIVSLAIRRTLPPSMSECPTTETGSSPSSTRICFNEIYF
ncbi:hypothetical protein NQ318_014097 [Aromia moschata]|uniref:Peptidase S1 domain-containing protein n=1 Tax=Aromia moschata TaxID=1265417 RepID=A0AAV8Z0M4_9CUCU|nr:hypothetical protein NQ318_014097 [Aromia moschata]